MKQMHVSMNQHHTLHSHINTLRYFSDGDAETV